MGNCHLIHRLNWSCSFSSYAIPCIRDFFNKRVVPADNFTWYHWWKQKIANVRAKKMRPIICQIAPETMYIFKIHNYQPCPLAHFLQCYSDQNIKLFCLIKKRIRLNHCMTNYQPLSVQACSVCLSLRLKFIARGIRELQWRFLLRDGSLNIKL